MVLDKKNILHLADLAKLQLTDQEVQSYARQLSDILVYVEKIKKLDLAKVKASLSGIEEKNSASPRPDQAVVSEYKLKNDFVVVPQVFENHKDA